MAIKAGDIAKMIDHSLLNPVMTRQDIIDGCKIAEKYGTASVCVKPCDVDTAIEILRGTDVPVSTVIGFPHGCHTTGTKVFEAEQAIRAGCRELDMVQNIGRLLGGEHEYVRQDIRAVCDAAHRSDVIVKVILENAYLDDELIATACKLACEAGADFVKTSTGYAKSGATLHDLRIMKANVKEGVRVKAAGRVRTLDAALKARAVGAARVGATATAAIMEEAYRRESRGELIMPADDSGEF